MTHAPGLPVIVGCALAAWVLSRPTKALASVVVTPAKPPAKTPAKPSTPSTPSTPGGLTPAPTSWAGFSNSPIERSAQLLAALKQGRGDLPFTEILTSHENHRALLSVSAQAAQLDGVRVSLTARDQAALARHLGAGLLTKSLVDRIYKSGLRLAARPQPWSADGPGGRGTMGDLRRIVEYSGIVDAELLRTPGHEVAELIANEGKDWIVSRGSIQNPGRAANYGFFKPSGKPWQPPALAHNLDHSDYSQLARFVKNQAMISLDEGKSWTPDTVDRLAGDPILFRLVSDEILPFPRP